MNTNKTKSVISGILTIIAAIGVVVFLALTIGFIVISSVEFWERSYLKIAALCFVLFIICLVYLVKALKEDTRKAKIEQAESENTLKERREVSDIISQTLYYRFGTRFEHWSIWVEEKNGKETIEILQGTVGKHGEKQVVATAPNSTAWATARDEFEKKVRQGYTPFDEKDEIWFDVICQVEDLMTSPCYSQEVCYHHKLGSCLSNLLLPTGVGEVSFPVEETEDIIIYCSVVDFEIAKELIEKELVGTEFQKFEIHMVEKEK